MLYALSCTAFVLSFVYFSYCYKRRTENDFKLPPGPRGLPLLGNLHQLGGDASVILTQWAEQYGKLYTIHLGTRTALVINDATLMKRILGHPASTGKFHSEVFNVLFGGPYGILNTGGKTWTEQRSYLVKVIKRETSTKTSSFERLVMLKLDNLCDWIKRESSDDGKVYFNQVLRLTTGSIIWATMTEETADSEISTLSENFMQTLQKVTNSGLAFFSWIKYIAPHMSGYNEYTRACGQLQDFVERNFEDPRRREGRHKDLLYKFREHAKSVENNSCFYGELGRKQCLGSLLGLLVGGSQTTAVTMNFLIFYLCAHPEVQSRVQKEIAEVERDGDDVCLDDRKRMPYTEAVIEETLRLSVAAPLGIMHELLEDVDILQFKLPKDLIIIPNIHYALSNPVVWEEPTKFKPERFLMEGSFQNQSNIGVNYTKLKALMVAFQPGKRTCPGEQIARDVLFLFTTKLCKTFGFSVDIERNKEEYMEKVFSSIQMPKTLPVIVISQQ